MKSFFRTLIAVIVADVLIFGVLILVVVSKLQDGVDIKSGTVLVQTIGGSITEYDAPSGPIPFSESPETLTSILENLDKARHDDRIKAVLLRLSSPSIGWASLNELRGKIETLRTAGIEVCAYTEHLTTRSLYVGSACDKIFLLPGGYISLHGFAAGHPFVKGTLEKLGIKENIHRIEGYKSAAEIIQREDMSAEARENLEWMLDEIYPHYVQAIEADRGLKPGAFETDVLAKGALVPREALDLGLVDRLAYFDEVETHMCKLKGVETRKKENDAAPDRPRMVSGGEYAKVPREKAGIKGKKTIAVVHAQGMIAGEKNTTAFPFGMLMGAGTMEEAFRQASEDKDVAAIVFRIDSGGGESSTSWKIGRAAERASHLKPVVVSMSDVAASGAYMIAYPCSTLVADELSVVGSIGSISGKFNMRGLYNKLGITWDFVTRGPNALMDSDYSDYTSEQYHAFTSRHWMDYWEWVEDIAQRRNLTPDQVDSVGRGRVWTGSQALAHGLIDTLGGFDVALQIAKAKAGIPAEEEVKLLHYPVKEGPLEALKSGGFSAMLYTLVHDLLGSFENRGSWAIDWNRYR